MEWRTPPCTLAFESLAERPFENSRIGNLAAIHQPGINLVLGERTFSPKAMERLRQLDVMELVTAHGTLLSPKGGAKHSLSLDGNNVPPQDLLASIGPALERILPAHPANRLIAQDLALMLQETAAVYNNAPMTYHDVTNATGAQGVFHHDNYTEHRWLVTLPTGKAPGTLVADDFTRQYPVFPYSNPMAGTQYGDRHNNYGRPSALWQHLIREAPTGHMLGWHGEKTGTPRIHSEPDVVTAEQARITIIAVPTFMNERDSLRPLPAPGT